MRIDGPKKTDEIKAPKPKPAGKTGDASFSNLVAGGASSVGGASPAMPSAPVGGIFMLQAVSDEERRKRKEAITVRHESLDILDELALALANNQVSVDYLGRLKEQAQKEAPDVNDPALEDLLAQIDIRLAVEMAKLERSQDK